MRKVAIYDALVLSRHSFIQLITHPCLRAFKLHKEPSLKKSSILSAAIAVSLASLLAACGGGGGGTSSDGAPAPEAPSVAWASPAVFVTPGAASKTFGLDCTRVTNTYIYNQGGSDVREPMYTATLKISANGDMTVSAATSTTGTIAVLQSIALADAGNYSWNVSGTIETPTYRLNVNQPGRDSSKSLSVYASGDRYVVNGLPSEFMSQPTGYVQKYYDCSMTDPLALQVNADAARAAKNLGAAAGVTTYDDFDAPGRIEGGYAYWETENQTESSSPYDFMRFDLKTGSLASSMSTTDTYSAISLSLPSGINAQGSYGESFQRASSNFEFKDAKTICLSKSSQDPEMAIETGYSINAIAYGQKLSPYSRTYRNGGSLDDRTSNTVKMEGGGCGDF